MGCSRGWVVVAAASIINVFTLAVMRSGAIIYVGIASTFGVSREDAAWPVCLATVFNLAAGPISGILAQHFQISTLLVVGCFLASLPVCASYFANGVPFLILTLGVLHGCGLSLLTLGYAAVNQSVTKNKALASGITIGGSVVGGIIFPPVIQFLFDKYGTKGGLLVFGAIMLNSTAAALFTRTSWRGNAIPQDLEKSAQNSTTTCLSEIANRCIYEANGDARGLADNVRNCCDNHSLSPCNGTVGLDTPLNDSACKKISACGRAVVAADGPLSAKTQQPPQTTLAKWLSFLKNPRFYVIAYTLGQIWYLNTTLLTVVVDAAMERGIPKWDAVSLVTFITAPDLVSRFLSGPITDKGLLRKSSMMVLSLTTNGIAHLLMTLFTSYPALAALSAVSGSCNGVAVTHIFVLCGELVDPVTFGLCMGAANFVAAFALLERPLMIGYCKDKLGSYDGLFYFSAGVAWSCAIPLAHRILPRESNLEEKIAEGSNRGKMVILFREDNNVANTAELLLY
ncbi:monocarboxylate transporter 12-like [Dermacentor silvarum]|uniref:monocarboxylate transporter 12-like n=1 Tax=Dermacentor silvarum TaxID=543639 RepID=UPI00189BF3AD|nr:monocarboxylate transporter 12-like [Dermacentor silvarum]